MTTPTDTDDRNSAISAWDYVASLARIILIVSFALLVLYVSTF